jgi:hyperosmotically inducible protein
MKHVVEPSGVAIFEQLGRPEMRNGQFARIACAVALILVCAAGVAKAADTPDAWVTIKTKVSLMTTEGISTKDLNVDTVNGVVTLHGKVATEAEKVKAGDVARRIEGAKEVKNLLQVVPSAQRAVVKRSDDAIKQGVEAAFKANRRVNTSGITIASVNNGVVLLSGKTKSFEAYLESVEVANAVRGVRRVSTEVEVIPAS